MKLADLKKDMPYKYRVQQAKQYGANCVAYVDSRDVQDLLDSVVGAENWQDKYEEVKGNLFCSIGIKCGEDWVWKTDCGTESNVDKQKGEASDAFKRAAVKWGIGRFLYSLPMPKLNTGIYKQTKDGKGNPKYYPLDGNGQILWDKDKLTEYCRSLNGKNPPTKKTPAKKPATDKPSFKVLFGQLPKMTDQEAAAMSSIWLIAKDHKPEALTENMFKYEACVFLHKAVGHWPITEQEQEEAITILDKEYSK